MIVFLYESKKNRRNTKKEHLQILLKALTIKLNQGAPEIKKQVIKLYVTQLFSNTFYVKIFL